MKRRLRLRHPQNFARVRDRGRTYRSSSLIMGYVRNAGSSNRYGFVVGRRVGNAVTRNRVRRLLREAVRRLHPHMTQGYDVVFVARSSLVEKPFSEVLRIVTIACEETRLVQEDLEVS